MAASDQLIINVEAIDSVHLQLQGIINDLAVAYEKASGICTTVIEGNDNTDIASVQAYRGSGSIELVSFFSSLQMHIYNLSLYCSACDTYAYNCYEDIVELETQIATGYKGIGQPYQG
jgi:hypothetical protein